VTERRDHGASQDTVAKFSYNDHGDVSDEVETTSANPNRSNGGDTAKPSSSPADSASSRSESNVRFRYQYDTFGNWIEQTVSSQSGASEPVKSPTITRRTITYY
jgi:hypothetical protein